jgi:hypothetical protein
MFIFLSFRLHLVSHLLPYPPICIFPPSHPRTSHFHLFAYILILLLTLTFHLPTAFECPQPGCGRTFSVNSNMRRHYRTHAPDSSRPGTANDATSGSASDVPEDRPQAGHAYPHPHDFAYGHAHASHPPSSYPYVPATGNSRGPMVYEGSYGYAHASRRRPGSGSSTQSGERV